METDFGPKMITFAARNLLPWALYAAPLGPAPRAARTGGRGRDACLRLRVPVPTHQRTAVGDFGTKNNHGRPDPHPHRSCTRRGASCSRSRHPRADRTCATGNGRADTHGGGTGPSRDRAAHAPPPPPVARTRPRQRAVETRIHTIWRSPLPCRRHRRPPPPPPRATAATGRFPRASRVERAAGEGEGGFGESNNRRRPDPTRTAHAPAALRTRAPTGLARPEMAVQTRTGAARGRRATERRTHYPTRRWHARSRCKEPLKHGTAPFLTPSYLGDVTAAPRRRSPVPPPPPAASSARPASNALPWRGGRFW